MAHDPWSNRDVTTAVVAVADLLDKEGKLSATYVFNSGRRSEVRTTTVQP